MWGPVIGAVILIPLSEMLQAQLGAVIPGIQGVIYGLAIVAVILLAPEGLFWRVSDLLRRSGGESRRRHRLTWWPSGRRCRHRAVACVGCACLAGGAPDLSRAFGGLRAVQDVSFTCPARARSSA